MATTAQKEARAKVIALFALITAAFPAQAAEFALQINGLSWHSEKRIDYVMDDKAYFYGKPSKKVSDYNESNNGIGIQITHAINETSGVYIKWAAGTLKNSMRDQTIYAGGALVKRWGDEWRIEAGMFVGPMTYPSHKNGWLMAAAPIVTFGTRRAGVNVLILPPVEDIPTVVFVQTYIGF